MSQSPSRDIILTDKMYNVLKHVVSVGLPAVSALYFALAQIWHFRNADEVMATIAAINVFFGAIVGVSNFQYNNSDSKYAGELQVAETADKKIFSLAVNEHPDALADMKEATFKISPIAPAELEP